MTTQQVSISVYVTLHIYEGDWLAMHLCCSQVGFWEHIAGFIHVTVRMSTDERGGEESGGKKLEEVQEGWRDEREQERQKETGVDENW